ncbi:hypothetical protein KIPB_017244, partial [Kipferlia bialata]
SATLMRLFKIHSLFVLCYAVFALMQITSVGLAFRQATNLYILLLIVVAVVGVFLIAFGQTAVAETLHAGFKTARGSVFEKNKVIINM